ncbi:MAG: DUF2059 domain-containing protein [Gammaproteobacteria bacterium]|uniref:DUF2059 domain-containing protein n=1 Tax=Luteimonas sp. JM171 TaxID=1896164 RepID=UPI0012F830B2|nr:DUF2059 domain-containing protein [Luteimonas sp. JM171]NLC60474.1 DUF2059 domain-containing protein [Gammaproteobacteria bacterium]
MTRFIRILTLALLLGAAPLAAAQPPSQAQIDRLLEVMRARETLDAVIPQVQASQQQMVAQMTAGQELDAEERSKINRVIEITNARLAETLTWETMEPIYHDIYARTFTGEDVDAMIEFYASPAGQKTLEKMPQLMQNTMQAMQQLVMPVLQQLEQEIAAELGG